MDNKSQRLAQITKIIQNEQVTSQDQLLQSLILLGYNTTQATLSRDLKLLKVAKMPDGLGGYRYIMANSLAAEQISPAETGSNQLQGFLSLEFSGTMGVIRTIPAFSHTIALRIDNAMLPEIIGTLAGNDTIFFVQREGFTRQQVIDSLTQKFPDIVDKVIH